MSYLAILLGPASSATHFLGGTWLRWVLIGCGGAGLVLEWFVYLKGRTSSRRVLLLSGLYGSIIVVQVLGLLFK
ncbi:MAG: hypothetical protein WBL61_03015 [Bryobacteraceae bacterium]